MIRCLRCFGAAAAKDHLDIAVRDAINDGSIPGPRSLANAREIAKTDGELSPDISFMVDNVDGQFHNSPIARDLTNPSLDFRRTVKTIADLGADNIKLSMSGEAITEIRSAEDCYYTEEETKVATEEAHRLGKRVYSHAEPGILSSSPPNTMWTLFSTPHIHVMKVPNNIQSQVGV